MSEDETLAPNNPINQSMEAGGLKESAPVKDQPVYKMVGDQRIPISKSAGKLWKARLDHANKLEKDYVDLWKECLEYYENTASGLRNASDGNSSRSAGVRGTHNNTFSEIENIVFSHISSIVPHIYSQNPTIEVTPTKTGNEDLARAFEELAKALMIRKGAPNIKIKQLIRKMIVVSILCKNSYAVVTWTPKEQSSEQAIKDLQRLSKEMQDAKTPQQIKDIEGKLTALENTIDFLSPAGPKVSMRLPWEVVIDPTTRDDDGDDASWMMVADMIPWTYIKARFGTDSSMPKSLYEPTHMLRSDSNNDDDLIMNNFQLIPDGEGADFRDFGFDDAQVYERSQYVKVWTVYDKVARRIYLYNDKDWTWPLWVWDDPYGLQGFFNVVTMSNYTSPIRTRGKGEIAYVLDQQDTINEANDAKSRARFSMLNNIVYNSNKLTGEQVATLFEPGKQVGIGVALDSGETIDDHIKAFSPPIMGIPQLLDKTDSYNVVDRTLGTTDVMRGAQFKTNTTNDAVEAVTSIAQNRLDEKTDIVEDAVGNIMHKVLELCIQFMDQQTVIDLIGQEYGAAWKTMTPQEFARDYSMHIVGGSTAKPTASYKQKQALDIGQVLGQYASSSPVTLLVILRIFERSFNEVVMTDDDWNMLISSIEAQLQPQGQQAAGDPQQAAATDPLEQALAQLPPEAQDAVKRAVQSGVPPEEALSRVTQALQQQTAANV